MGLRSASRRTERPDVSVTFLEKPKRSARFALLREDGCLLAGRLITHAVLSVTPP